ncbi:MAG: hypothetical protein EXR71_03070 [Myxococcales bacterium]|nr:hypothetical protein [Myxococcales bacterium]
MWTLLALIGCETPVTDSADPAPEVVPWTGLTTPLDPFRKMLSVETDAGPDGRLAAVSLIPGLAVWPRNAGGAALLDARYRLGDGPGCLDPGPFPAAEDGADRQGACAAGEVELDRTHLAPDQDVLQVVDDAVRHEVSVLLSGGRVRSANTDLSVGNPWDWLRLGPERVLLTDAGDAPGQIAPDGRGGWWGLVATDLVRWAPDGSVETVRTLTSAGHQLFTDPERVWVAAETTLESSDGLVVDLTGVTRLRSDGAGGLWAAAPGAATLHHVDGAGVVGLTVPLPGASGPIAVDNRTGRLYALAEGEVVVLVDGVEVGRYPHPNARDIAVNGSGEIAVLDEAGDVTIFVDETALLGAAPLDAWVASFIENPRAESSRVDCAGTDEGMEERTARAVANRVLLSDLPATTALAVSPPVGPHSQRCKVDDTLADVLTGPRLDVGVLFHDAPDCADQGCLDAALTDELADLALLTDAPAWVAGAAGWESGGDWVVALVASGFDRHAFVGMSALPDVAMTDPRAKDALPWAGESAATPWRVTAAAAAEHDDAAGKLLLIPGSTLAIFNLSGCPGALQAECRFLGLGGGETLERDDLEIADLLLHRAAANRADSGGSTWYVHLPAIEEFAYTDECTRSDERLWSGEACQAARLQGWLIDVQARLVTAGIVRWGSPRAVAWPD